MKETVEWRNGGITPTIGGVVDAIAIVPILYWCVGASVTRFIFAGLVIGILTILKRYGFTMLTVFRFGRSRLARYLGGGRRPSSNSSSLFKSLDETHF